MVEVSASTVRTSAESHLAAVARAIERMRSELASTLYLSDLATAGMFSPFHFHRMFRIATTMTPARFLAALRMAQAKRLLLHTALTVAAIGSRVGYSSTGTFTTQFTRLVGTSPLRFRELARGLTDRRISQLLTYAGADLRRTQSHPLGLLWFDRSPAAGHHEARVLIIDTEATPTEALVDELPGSYLTGGAKLVLASASLPGGRAEISLRRPQLTDPPALSVAPLRWLADLSTAGRKASGSPRHVRLLGCDAGRGA